MKEMHALFLMFSRLCYIDRVSFSVLLSSTVHPLEGDRIEGLAAIGTAEILASSRPTIFASFQGKNPGDPGLGGAAANPNSK